MAAPQEAAKQAEQQQQIVEEDEFEEFEAEGERGRSLRCRPFGWAGWWWRAHAGRPGRGHAPAHHSTPSRGLLH